MNLRLALLAVLLPAAALGGSRNSAAYFIAADAADSGGQRTTSANYTNDGSVGLIAGISAVATPEEVAKHGYVGQLYDVIGFSIGASPATVNEGGTLQLRAGRLLDDMTTLALPVASVAWSVLSGPLTGINASGVATAGIVYQNTAATAKGVFEGNTATLALTVLNSNPDNFGAYGGDGLDDAWQVQYFGQPPNANAGPTVDFDGDGQNNLFECIAGLSPTDPSSRFTLSIAPVPGQATQKNLIFSPVMPGRTYMLKSKSGLVAATWDPATVSPPSDSGATRTITDLDAAGVTKFYRIEITKP